MTANYVSHDFDTILESLISFMQADGEFKDYNYEGSGIRSLLRVLSYNAQMQAYTDNMVFNELHLDTGMQRNNVASVAGLLNYIPRSIKAASYVCDITVTPTDVSSAPIELVLKRSAKFNATKDGMLYVFSPTQEYSTPLVDGKYVFSSVVLKQGEWTVSKFQVSGSAIDTYVIPNTGIDMDTLSVDIQTSATDSTITRYQRYTSIHDVGPTSLIYYPCLNRDGKYAIEFGDDVVSKKVVDGNIVLCSYMNTLGPAGNDITTLYPASSVGGYSSVVLTPISARSYGGADPEDVSTIKKKAPMVFSAAGRAVSPDDYATIASDIYPIIQNVIGWDGGENVPPKYGYTFIAAKPKGTDGVLSDVQKQELTEMLSKYNVGSVTPIITDPYFMYINGSTTITYNPTKTTLETTALKSKVKDYIRKWSAINLENFGKRFEFSTFVAYLTSIDPSFRSNITMVNMERRFIPELNTSGSYVINFRKPVKAGSLRISGFTISDVEQATEYFMSDTNGVINMYKVVDGVTKFVQKCGSVSYDMGSVVISNFRPSTTPKGYCSCTCEIGEYSQDINAVRDDILIMGDIKVELKKGDDING